MKHLTIRWRLTLWYGIVLTATLVVFSVAVNVLMRHHLLALTDAGLAEELVELKDEIGRAKSMTRLSEELRLRFGKHSGYEFLITDAAGRIVFQSDQFPAGAWRPETIPGSSSRLIYENRNLDGMGYSRVVSRAVSGPAGAVVIRAAISLAPNEQAMRELVAVLLSIGPLALTGTLGGGYWLARKALAPVDRMAATAAEITSSRLDRRLATPDSHDELGRLATTFNDMIARLQRSFEEVRRFTADAAHELRTPLALMRTEAEVALRSPRSPEQDSRVLENLLEEIDRLTRLIAQLLFLCREDAGVATGDRQPVRLDEVIREVADHVQVAALEKGLCLKLDDPASCRVLGDADRLRQLVFNLLDNAIKYTPAGGTITVRGESPNGYAKLIVADTGVGIPPDHLPHVFDRFYRVDPSRSDETEGAGLGLSICRSIAEAHGGGVQIESATTLGTRVTLVLPVFKDD
jgi:two-component system, OmpR family, heavy metal sensor histidine kinase CusS